MRADDLVPIGWWQTGPRSPCFSPHDLVAAVPEVRRPVHVVREAPGGRVGVGFEGEVGVRNGAGLPLLATLPAIYPEWLGERGFCERHGLRFPYVAGAMANGIATVELVEAMCRAGMIGFFGAAGLSYERVEQAVQRLRSSLGESPNWGANLIHSPNEAALEARVAELYLREGVRRVSASAYMALTPAIVHYAASGLTEGADGRIHRRNHVFAKISRAEVARRFLSPAPAEMLAQLVAQGKLTEAEARLATKVPVAESITVEADSGGHTDNQCLTALFPTILALRDELAAKHGYTRPIHVGAAGGLGTPGAVAAAFSMGAAYVLTGSVNQAAVESGLSEAGREMLARAAIADVMMAPAADMFELGVKVQVLRRGTMFGVRAQRLYETWLAHEGIEAMPPEVRQRLEAEVLGASLDEVWAETRAFWGRRDPAEVERAERDPKHRMALCFRWYLGLSSRWAITGEAPRRMDFQIWCGPAMGAFNAWTAGSFLADPANRTAVQIAHNLLEGAAVLTRAQQLRTFGVPVPEAAFQFRPRPLA